ncbi:hypothetical protein SEA_WATERFOUL_87 [Mycobacterium phage Waterfoul]|nr:hypothetical protein SEA_WATERFOUL_87 [Mycobacterium phage Waterfoul]
MMSKQTRDDLAATIREVATDAEVYEEVMGEHVELADVKITRGGPRTRVLQVRLDEREMQFVEDAAAARGLPASTVAREILLSTLRRPSVDPDAKAELVGAFVRYLEGVDQKIRCDATTGPASVHETGPASMQSAG